MNITKYEHACVVLEDNTKKLVIDPGVFSKSFKDVSNVIAVVVTHVHQDHFDSSHVDTILAANPEAKIFTIQAVADQLSSKPVQVMTAGKSITVGPFNLTFWGGDHALIHQSIPRVDNIGVLVNQAFYYPGDSFTIPNDAHVQVLALPVNAPWLKLGEAMDFLEAIKPRMAFPTHNAFQNEASEGLTNTYVGGFAASLNIKYQPMAVNEQSSF